MQKLLLHILGIFLPVLPLQAALVSGWVKNAHPGDAVGIEVPHYYLDGRTGIFRTMLDAQLRFSIDATVPEQGISFFMYNDDRLPIYLSESDTLALKTDAFQFPMAVTFSGKNGGNNRLFQEYLKQNELDFNEFNNIRFKIGQAWVVVEDPVNGRMENLGPDLFKGAMDAQKALSMSLVDDFVKQDSSAVDSDFLEWLNTEIQYNWAYHLLVYGQVYAGRYGIEAPFFDFLYDAPIINNHIGSEWYRRFLMAFMARQQVKSGSADQFWAGQYQLAEKLLDGVALAFFRSELIATAFSAEHFAEILPLYKQFMQKNAFKVFDDKIEGLYQKYARVFPGATAPDFEATDRNGQLVRLAQFKGKVVYLNFWASWCGACLRKMEFFDEFEAELSANGIQIINISIDENPAAWETALNAHLFKGRQLLASATSGQNIAERYGVEAVPQYFIIGKTGLFEIKASGNQPNDVRQQLLDISRHGN